jgi:hypothetical protein
MLEPGERGEIGECSTQEGTTVGDEGGVVLDCEGASAFFGGNLNS